MAAKREGGTPLSVYRNTTKVSQQEALPVIHKVMQRLQAALLTETGSHFTYHTLADRPITVPDSACKDTAGAPLQNTTGVWVQVNATKLARTGGARQEAIDKLNGTHGPFTAVFIIELGHTKEPDPTLLEQMCERIIVRYCRAYVCTAERVKGTPYLLDCFQDKRSVWHHLEASWDAGKYDDNLEAAPPRATPRKAVDTWLGTPTQNRR
jgi:hypothetical protein